MLQNQKYLGVYLQLPFSWNHNYDKSLSWCTVMFS